MKKHQFDSRPWSEVYLDFVATQSERSDIVNFKVVYLQGTQKPKVIVSIKSTELEISQWFLDLNTPRADGLDSYVTWQQYMADSVIPFASSMTKNSGRYFNLEEQK